MEWHWSHKEDHNEIIEKVATNRYKKKYWSTTDILVVDEVSMLSKSVFELLDKIGRRIKKDGSTLPFGGIQLTCCRTFINSHQYPKTSVSNQVNGQKVSVPKIQSFLKKYFTTDK